ncbi:glycosyl hydrolase [Durotheca rogersii]|uniref:glycosyl hydrolase n=1 Tax=Durotheca rogersii TaxID=419775 RepID=UPI00221EC9D2|nr:glycosyl hydrolase [Durotheca rogersii]KAI5867999.1 glycosyl hydrolase [Durotheca rogersii]
MTTSNLLESKSRWHPTPSYHLKALRGWMNDPCAPGFDPSTGEYHLFYQWNPKSCDWGDICWGHFASPDGVRWQHNGADPVLAPALSHEDKGIFTGCMRAACPRGEKRQLTVFYSSEEEEKQLYGVLSGGVVGEGPNAFLYAVAPDDLATWTYLGPLVDIPARLRRPGRWGGDFGVNWECKTQKTPGEEDPHGLWALWMGGILKKDSDGRSVLAYDFGGVLDHGTFYAPNSYKHPETGERIVWGWIREEELTLARREPKGWTGYLSLPRELFFLRLPNVIRALKTPLDDISAVKVLDRGSAGGGRAKTVRTLGVRPWPALGSLRPEASMSRPSIATDRSRPRLLAVTKSTNWELEATIKVRPGLEQIGFHVRHDRNSANSTKVYFSAGEEQIVVDETLSNSEADIKKEALAGPFTLFVFGNDGSQVVEDLRLRIFSDGDVLEVFANDRFALSTTVYADALSCLGISCFVQGKGLDIGGFESTRLIKLAQGANPFPRKCFLSLSDPFKPEEEFDRNDEIFDMGARVIPILIAS